MMPGETAIQATQVVPDDILLPLKDLLSYLPVSESSLQAWAAQGRIQTIKLGSRRFVKKAEIVRLMSEGM
jgi:hypothetical protein